jgi:hypothetical protein
MIPRVRRKNNPQPATHREFGRARPAGMQIVTPSGSRSEITPQLKDNPFCGKIWRAGRAYDG